MFIFFEHRVQIMSMDDLVRRVENGFIVVIVHI
ncbi:hypothetical protein MDG893_07135 [Marinobacter algicola DG893]|uniref:Uncharacterized protein n=1 Tax=Marinobacter algicola DG893 TaxID=443152 RepID=A6EVW4_9GAMM|nr:hypothetical protein MDG893_07135 [Marinobacter algicola DG893]